MTPKLGQRAALAFAATVAACTPSGGSNRAGAKTEPPAPIAFIEDDFARAIALARARHQPVFVDVWASWCHSCMSMKEYVFSDARIRAKGNELVWLSVDSERAENADFLDRFRSTSLPTLWIIDAVSEKPVLKWIGAATAPELASLLDDTRAALDHHDTGGEAGAAALQGDHASSEGHFEEAASAYQRALELAPKDWPKRARVVEALSARLLDLKRYAACVALAEDELPRLPAGTSRVNVIVNALSATELLPTASPASPASPAAEAQIAALVRAGTRIAEDGSQPILVDDRSGLFESLVATLHQRNPSEARRLARAWATLLEGEAARAPTPAARAVWDPHRLGAYIELGEVEKALPMLQQSERDFPSDYNPPARLARAYFELKRLDEARKAVLRAKGLSHGPRKLRILMLEADIHLAQGDREEARRALDEAVALAGQLRLPPNYASLRALLDRRRAELQ